MLNEETSMLLLDLDLLEHEVNGSNGKMRLHTAKHTHSYIHMYAHRSHQSLAKSFVCHAAAAVATAADYRATNLMLVCVFMEHKV